MDFITAKAVNLGEGLIQEMNLKYGIAFKCIKKQQSEAFGKNQKTV
jgi:hypothetical protein